MTPVLLQKLLRLLPARLSQSFYYHYLRDRAAGWPALYECVRLRFAPSCRMTLVPGDEVSGAIALTGVYELELTRLLLAEARTGGLLVDVGANLGYHSLLWAGQGRQCESLAIEADPSVFSLLQANLAANPGARVRAVPVAASDSRGSVRFAPAEGTQKGWGRVAEGGVVELPCARLDDLVADRDTIRCLKIDAEGHDIAVLKGASGLLRERRIEQVFFESSAEELDSPGGRALVQNLLACGYCAPRRLGRPSTGVAVYSIRRLSDRDPGRPSGL